MKGLIDNETSEYSKSLIVQEPVMKFIIAIAVFAVSMFCGLVIVANGVLAGRYETLFPYTAGSVCAEGEELTLEKSTSTTGGAVVIDGNVYNDVGYTENTLYCVDQVSGDRRDVTVQTYDEVLKLQTRIGWWVTFGLFVVIMLPILVFWSAILKRFDRLIGYKPQQ
jgi:hypothetical protein